MSMGWSQVHTESKNPLGAAYSRPDMRATLVRTADHGFDHFPLAPLHLINGDGNFLEIALLVIGIALARATGLLQSTYLGQIIRRLGGSRLLHGGNHVPRTVVLVRSIDNRTLLEALLVSFLELGSRCLFLKRNA